MQKLTQLIKPSIILENTIHKQTFMTLGKSDGTRCALGVIFGDLPGWSLTKNGGGCIHNGKQCLSVECYLPEMNEYLGMPHKRIDCPLCRHGDGLLTGVILHLNDGHKCTFKEIAIWLRAIGC